MVAFSTLFAGPVLYTAEVRLGSIWSPSTRAGAIHPRADRRGTQEGLDAARASDVRLGRPPALTSEQIRHARDLLTRPEDTVSIARLLGVSRATIYKYVPELPASTWPAVALPREPKASGITRPARASSG